MKNRIIGGIIGAILTVALIGCGQTANAGNNENYLNYCGTTFDKNGMTNINIRVYEDPVHHTVIYAGSNGYDSSPVNISVIGDSGYR